MSDNPTIELPLSDHMLPWREDGTPEGFAEAKNILSVGSIIWKQLTPGGEDEFRQNARNNYVPLTNIEGIWHPVYQLECVLINHETGFYRRHDS